MAHQQARSDEQSIGNLRVAFFLNLGFTVIELAGGILTNSVAILSDAIHDLGDCLSLGTAWYLQNLSKKGRTPSYTYGYKRFSLFGALITSIVLVVGSIIILYEAVPRLFDPETPDTSGMLLLAVLGVVVNGLAVLRTRKGTSLNEQLVSLHLLEDVLGWVAVLIGAGIMHFFDIPIIDPLLSIGITVFILFNVIRRLTRAGKIMLQATPEGLDIDDIKVRLEDIAQVHDVHHMHVWSLDGEYNIVTIHVKVPGNLTVKKLKSIKDRIRLTLEEIKIEHVTIEFEALDEDCE